MSKAYIGTSGWNYKHWSNGVFYPQDLSPSRWLEFYAKHFDTVEINNTFYRLPGDDVFIRWRRQVPAHFVFAVKASRFLTHIKRLKDPDDALDLFFSRANKLKPRSGPVLFQLPPQFKLNMERLEIFLTAVRRRIRRTRVRCVMEVRDATWLNDQVFDLLHKYRVALCFADWREMHVTQPVTTDFVYVRRHYGPLAGNYGRRQLDKDLRQIQEWLRKGLDVFVYFNNDMNGHAIRNAKYLRERLT